MILSAYVDQFVAVFQEETRESGTTIFAVGLIPLKQFVLYKDGTDVQ